MFASEGWNRALWTCLVASLLKRYKRRVAEKTNLWILGVTNIAACLASDTLVFFEDCAFRTLAVAPVAEQQPF